MEDIGFRFRSWAGFEIWMELGTARSRLVGLLVGQIEVVFVSGWDRAWFRVQRAPIPLYGSL